MTETVKRDGIETKVEWFTVIVLTSVFAGVANFILQNGMYFIWSFLDWYYFLNIHTSIPNLLRLRTVSFHSHGMDRSCVSENET